MSFDTGIANILSRAEALATAQKFDVFDTQIPTGYRLAYQNNASVPYVLLDFGDKSQVEPTAQGITSTKDNMKWTTILFEVVTPNPATNRQIKAILRNSFEGWVPDDGWGEMIERYNARYRPVESEGTEFWPARFATSLVYVADIDA